MRTPRLTLLVWSIFELALGVGLYLIPTPLLDVIGITEPDELWPVRAIGAVAVVLGLYYFAGTVADSRSFYRWTVFGRLVLAGLLAGLAVLDGPWQLWLFTILEAVGALWTFAALRPTPEPVPEPAEAVPAPASDDED